MTRAKDVRYSSALSFLQANRYREERVQHSAFHSWTGEVQLQALGRHLLSRTLMRQLAAVWVAWLGTVEVRSTSRQKHTARAQAAGQASV